MSMDHMLKANEQPFVSPPVIFNKYLIQAKATIDSLAQMAPGRRAKDNFQTNTGLSREEADGISNLIDVSDFRSEKFNRKMDSGLDRNRMTSQGILQDESSRRRNAQYRSIALRALKYDHMDHKALARQSPYLGVDSDEDDPEDSEKPTSSAASSSNCKKRQEGPGKRERRKMEVVDPATSECYEDLLLNISIYFGYTRELEYHEVRLGRLMKVTDRLEITGAHTLLDLKNAFSCPADYAFLEDFSTKKPTEQDFAKNKYPSAMFFIHDTFYIEPQKGRHWQDPSEHIREWAEKRAYIGTINVASMEETKLADLHCRLGQPYVFIHQGVCEHLIVFNDLMIRDESHANVEFPRKLVERNFRRIACDICKEESAQWMIVDHEMSLPNSPGYLCPACYKEFCFDVNGEKVNEFKAVPYCDRKLVGDGGKFIFSELRFEVDKEEKKESENQNQAMEEEKEELVKEKVLRKPEEPTKKRESERAKILERKKALEMKKKELEKKKVSKKKESKRKAPVNRKMNKKKKRK